MSVDKIACKACGAQVHSIQMHLEEAHPEMTVAQYRDTWPDAPLLSAIAEKKLAERLALKKESELRVGMAGAALATVTPIHAGPVEHPFHEVFGLGMAPAAMSARGAPIPTTVFPPSVFDAMVPDMDPNFVFDIENLKNAMLAMELNMPIYVWGHSGTGKTSLLEQICNRTRRPLLRVQHTIGTEEAHVLGQWTVQGGNTVFQLGPLALAMKHGWCYLADEYDFAMAAVLAVYQPVLEGKSLVIKDADPENRIIHPHPNFRFLATGNTNGSGDETGLYQGTQIQNAANYDRFGMVIEQKYLAPNLEAQAVAGQTGMALKDAEKMVDFACRVRRAFDDNQISSTVSPRALINAGKIGMRRGSYKMGLSLSFMNKLSKVDKVAVESLAQRVFS